MTSPLGHPLLRLGAAAGALAAAGPALAHHPMGGQTPQTWLQGLLSGLGHPVIGPDHLLFMVAIAALAALSDGGRPRLPLLFTLASLCGVLLHLSGLEVPWAEPAVAATLVAVALLALMAAPRLHRAVPWCAGGAGLLHGYVYGESIVGAEPGVLWSYLVGLGLVQGLLMLGLALGLHRALARAAVPVRRGIRVYSALAMVVGAGLSLHALAA